LKNDSSNKENRLELEPDISLLNDQFLDQHIILALNNNDNENQDFTTPPLDDDTFIKNVIEYAATCDESIIEDVFNLPSDLEDTLDPFMSFDEPRSGSTADHSKEPSVEVATPEEVSNMVSGGDEDLLDFQTTWTLDNYLLGSADPQTKKSPSSTFSEILLTVNDNSKPLPQYQTNLSNPTVSSSIRNTSTLDVDIDDYLVPPPISKTDVNFTSTTSVSPSIRTTWTLGVDDHLVPPSSSQADVNFPAVYTPFKLPIGNTDGDIVVEVAPIPAPSSPSRPWTVIKQGPVLSARQPGTQPQFSRVANKRGTSVAKSNSERNSPSSGVLVSRRPCPQAKDQNAKVTCKGGRSVPQSNAERCMTYRKKQQAKKEKEDEELRTLFEQNRMLKAKEAALKNKISKLKASLLKIGLGGFFY